MAVTLRPAHKNDALALAQLGAESFTETFGHLYQPHDLALFLQNHSEGSWLSELEDEAFAILVVEAADGQLAGYAKIGPPKLPFEPRGKAVELRQFYLLRPWHGSGIADDMMRWVIDEAERQRGDDLYLSVFTENHRARRFYERWGFEAEGRYAFMVGNHADEDIVMRKHL
jgi:GNAT superfamily N-acetyltransferase